MFTARYALSAYIKQTGFVFKGLRNILTSKCHCLFTAVIQKCSSKSFLQNKLTI